MKKQDIRWIQRLDNYCHALQQLEDAVTLAHQRELSNLEKQGLIQAFEFTHELAWKVMKDFFAYQGNWAINGSRDASREAFNLGLIDDGHVWMEMITGRNKSSHTYNETTAEELIASIKEQFCPAFSRFRDKMLELRQQEESS